MPIRDTPVCHTPLMSATESLIEWYFKILVRYRGFMKSTPMITMKYYHEISEIMRLDMDYSQSSESWILGLRTLRSVQSLPTKSVGLARPISEHFQLNNSDQDFFFLTLSKIMKCYFSHTGRRMLSTGTPQCVQRHHSKTLGTDGGCLNYLSKNGFWRFICSSSLGEWFP